MITKHNFATLLDTRHIVLCVYRLNHPTEGGTFRVLQKDLVLSGFHVPSGVSLET